MVRKAEIATDYQNLKSRYDDEHPQTKRAKRKLEIFDNAINEIMQKNLTGQTGYSGYNYFQKQTYPVPPVYPV